jgi:hypothetical protein
MRCPRLSIPTAVAAIAAGSLLVAGCGSSSPSSSSSSGSSGSGQQPTQVQQQQAVAFSTCMRTHGVSNFPDPGAAVKYALAPSTPHSPAFQSALVACRHLLPNNGVPHEETHSPAQIAAFVAFARCLRTHGFPSFPDPTASGQLTHEMLTGAGIDIHQPAAVRAADACVSVTHGYITKVDVARFIAGQ